MAGYLWLKIFHIGAMAVWLTGLFFLPRVFIAKAIAGQAADIDRLARIGKTVYFGVMTPAALVTVALGLALIAFGFRGVWFPAKMALVSLLVLVHLYFGQVLLDLARGRSRHRVAVLHALNWVPLGLVLAIAALSAAKP